MTARGLAFAGALAAQVAAFSARAEPPPGDPSALLAFSRHAVHSLTVLVNAAPGSPSAAACVGLVGADAPVPPAELRELVARGGELQSTRSTGGSVDCVVVPRSEVAFAIWMLAHRVLELSRAAGGAGASPSDGSPSDGSPSGQTLALRRLGELATLAADGAARSRPVVVTVSGALVPADVVQLVQEHFSPTAGIAPAATAATAQSTERLSVLEHAGAESPSVIEGWTAAPGDAAALQAAVAILADGEASRLSRLLRAQRGSALDVAPLDAEHAGTPLVGIAVRVHPGSTVDRVQRFVDGSLKQLRIVGPDEHEVARARALLTTRALLRAESPLGRAVLLTEAELVDGQAEAAAARVAAYGSLTAAAIRGAAQRSLIRTRRSIVEVYPPDYPQDDPALTGFDLYTVQAGDTWQSVSRATGIAVRDLARDNDLDPKYRLAPGQSIWVRPRQPGP